VNNTQSLSVFTLGGRSNVAVFFGGRMNSKTADRRQFLTVVFTYPFVF